MSKKVNLGGVELWEGEPGKTELLTDYISVDVRQLPGVDIVTDITKRLPFEDDSVDVLRSAHAIEHFRPQELQPALKEWFRVLKPSGELRIYCPNARAMAERYLEGKISIEDFSRLIMGRQDYPENTHHICFDPDRLKREVEAAGFVVEKTGLNRYPNSPTYPYDMGIIGKKP